MTRPSVLRPSGSSGAIRTTAGRVNSDTVREGGILQSLDGKETTNGDAFLLTGALAYEMFGLRSSIIDHRSSGQFSDNQPSRPPLALLGAMARPSDPATCSRGYDGADKARAGGRRGKDSGRFDSGPAPHDSNPLRERKGKGDERNGREYGG